MMQFIEVQDDGPEGSMTRPITVIGLSRDEVMTMVTMGVVMGVQATGDAILVAITDDPDALANHVQASVEKHRGPVDVYRTDGGD